jgi:hypothetical protein
LLMELISWHCQAKYNGNSIVLLECGTP